MKLSTKVMLISTVAALQGAAGDAPLPGSDVPREASPVPHAFVRGASGQYHELYRQVVADVTYDLAVASHRVVYVGTESKAFKTPEDIRVGSKLATVKAIPGAAGHGSLSGDYSLVLPSGWTAVFRYGSKRTKASLSVDAEVIYLFSNRLPVEPGQQAPAADGEEAAVEQRNRQKE